MVRVEDMGSKSREGLYHTALSLMLTMFFIFLLAPAYAQAPTAGTEISNTSYASYTNQITSSSETVMSNTVVATVNAVPAYIISPDQEIIAAPADTVDFDFTITNTGNTDIVFVPTLSAFTGDFFVNPVTLGTDINDDGQIDASEVLSAGSSVTLAQGTQITIRVSGYVSELALAGQIASGVLSVTSAQITSGLSATATVTIDTPTVTLAKQVSASEAFAGDELIYTIALENPSQVPLQPVATYGGQPVIVDGTVQSAIILRDPFPAATTFSRIVDAQDFVPVYHVAGDDLYTFVTQLPADVSTVDTVAFLLYTDFAAGAYREVSFAAVVNSGTAGQSLINEAVAPLAQADGSAILARSNTTSTIVEAPAGGGESISIYENAGFSEVPSVIDFNQPLYIEVVSSICNSTDQIDTIQVVIETQPTGDRETVTATETGPQSGVFRAGPLSVTQATVVNVDDGTLSSNEDDVLSAQAQCDPDLVADLPVETIGYVFNSINNVPIAGVSLMLLDESDALISTATTDDEGRYELNIPQSGNYHIALDNLSGFLAPSAVTAFDGFAREIDPTGSYGQVFSVGASGRVDFDIPVDPPTTNTLSLNKSADAASVEPGRLVTYTIDIRNSSTAPLSGVELYDELPWGFSYVTGSARLDGVSLPDPAGVETTSLVFTVPTVAPVSTSQVTYAVRVGPNAGEGDRVNTVAARALLAGGVEIVSNVARAAVKVDVRNSVFSAEGVVLGKVFLDCNANGIQDTDNEPGIAGVQLHTQEGVTVVTDAAGRFSLPQLRPQTHVLDINEASLPAGTEIAVNRVMDAGNAGSRFVPLRAGEIRSEDFAVTGCSGEMLEEIEARRARYAQSESGLEAAPLQLDASNGRGFSDEYEKTVDVQTDSLKARDMVATEEKIAVDVSARFTRDMGGNANEGFLAGADVSAEASVGQVAHSYLSVPDPNSLGELVKDDELTGWVLEAFEAGTPVYQAMTEEGLIPCWYVLDGTKVKDTAFNRCLKNRGSYTELSLVEVMKNEVLEVVSRASAQRASLHDYETVSNSHSLVYSVSVPTAPVAETEAHLAELSEGPEVKMPVATMAFEDIQAYSSELDFIDLQDGDVVGLSTISIRVKGPSAGALALFVNGEEINRARIGQSIVDRRKDGTQIAEYVAIDLQEGVNTLSAQTIDPFGNVRGERKITIMAAGAPAGLEILAPKVAAADPNTPFKVAIRIIDNNGIEVAAPTELTLSASEGEWLTEDIRENEPGLQTYISEGRNYFEYRPSGIVGTHTITVESVFGKTDVPVQFVADYTQPPVFVGFIEGAYSFGENEDALRGLIEDDELSLFEETQEGVNGELYLKGKIRGDALLTMRYDSDKDIEDRLFRDVQPDRFYPVYGDRSQIGFDAQSQGRLFVKVEKGLSYLLYGDVRYNAQASAFQLGGYQRTLEGAKAHFERGRLTLDLYAAETDATQEVVEIPGLGISGPYRLDFDNVVENSETVEILTRDRDQPSVILSTERLARFTNYTLDYFDRSIIFNAPIASVDENLNPVSIRITFETANGAGEKYPVYGGEARLRVTDTISTGYRELRSDVPDDLVDGAEGQRTVRAAYVESEIGENTLIQLEVAQTESVSAVQAGGGQTLEETNGAAVRLSFNQAGDKHAINARIGYTDEEFDAPGANQQAGTLEARVQGTVRASEKITASAEGLYSDNAITDETRYGAVARVERQFGDNLAARAGARYVITEGVTNEDGEEADALFSAIAGMRWAPKFLDGANLDAELEQALGDADHFRVKFGADYTLSPKVKAYLLSEWASTDRGAFAIGESARSNTSIRGGVEYQLTEKLKGFTEYRANQGSFDAGVANGLSANWQASPDLSVRGRVEHVEALTEVYQGNTAAGVGATWQPEGGNAIIAADIEYSLAQSDQESWYLNNTAGFRTGDMTFLARNRYARVEEAAGDRVRDRLRVGAAWRPENHDTLNALAWYEFALEETPDVTERSHIWSVGGEYKLNERTRVRPRYAGQYYEFESDAVSDDSLLHMAQIGLDRDMTDDINISLNLAGLTDEDFANWHAGIGGEITFRVMDNLLLGAGYNYTTLEEENFRDLYQEGFFVRIRMKFDENTWNIFRD